MTETEFARFNQKWQPVTECGCWVWTGSQQPRGYGTFSLRGKAELAHRASYEHYLGKIPDGYELDHLCRVTSCVNPDHLDVVQHRENVMRGVGLAAHYVKRMHCPNGHPLSGDNLYVRTDSGRRCRLCTKQRMAAWRTNRIQTK